MKNRDPAGYWKKKKADFWKRDKIVKNHLNFCVPEITIFICILARCITYVSIKLDVKGWLYKMLKLPTMV